MRLIITRHGETIENKLGIHQGQSIPGILSEEGIKQAEKLAQRLSSEKIDIIYTSDLNRAYHTAKIVHEKHPSALLIISEKLRERSYGSSEGKKDTEIKLVDMPDVESEDNLMKRAKEIIDEILFSGYENVLAVTHGGFHSELVGNILGYSFNQLSELRGVKNTAITIFNPFPNMELYGCYEHLSSQ